MLWELRGCMILRRPRNENMGTPSHIEYLKLKEGEERRNKSRCRYYDRIEKQCAKRFGRCIGSSHCTLYREKALNLGRGESNLSPKDVKMITKFNSLNENNRSREKVTYSNVARMGDVITIEDADGEQYTHKLNFEKSETPEVFKLFCGKRLQYSVKYKGYNYKLIKIMKA